MRREDREITDGLEIESILHHANICRIGLAHGDEPYIVPLCFGYEDRMIYLHSALAGKKISMLKQNSRCCFEVDLCESLVYGERPCVWGMRYHSVIGFGRAFFIEDCEEKKKGLSCIMRHYSEETYQFSDEDVRNVCVIRIDIDSLTGKKHE